MTKIINTAYIRDGKLKHTGESVLLACLMKVRGHANRPRAEVEELGKVMRDPNLDD